MKNLTHSRRGFSLIELLIVVTMIGVLAAIAYPGYAEYSRNARRAEARAAITQIIQLQERSFNQNNAYQLTFNGGTPPAGWVVKVGDPNNPSYDITWVTTAAVGATPSFVTVTAKPTAKFADPKCGVYSMDTLGNKSVTDATQTAAQCWSR